MAGEYIEMGQALRQAIKETSGKDLPMNVDGGMAAVLCELGFPPELGNGFLPSAARWASPPRSTRRSPASGRCAASTRSPTSTTARPSVR